MDNLGECEVSYEELISKNKSLSEELEQCLRDKEFVWNLWKELQISNPNTTAIVNSVLQREQEKSDAKDLKVLNVLREKDGQIRILQEISADLQTQLKYSNERISELLVEQSDWLKSCENLNSELVRLKTEVDYKNELLTAKDQVSAESENNVKREVTVLEEKIEEMAKEEESLRHKIDSLNGDLENITKEKDNLQINLVSKDQVFVSLQEKLDTICKEKNILLDENEASKKNISKLKTNLKKKNKELEDVRGYWESEVNKNTKTINEQCEHLEQQQQQLLYLQNELNSHENCLKRIEEQSHLIERLEGLQDESQKVLAQQHCTYEEEADLHKKTIKTLKKKVSQLQKETVKTACEKRVENVIPVSPAGNDYEHANDPSPNPVKCHEKCTQTTYSKKNDYVDNLVTAPDSAETESYVEMLVNLVKSMEVELEIKTAAHQRRCERYKLLEENCNLLCQQLATYEDGNVKTEKKIPRASSKSLQREGSRSVWNELEFYRQQYEKYKFEEPKLNEEMDQLKVGKADNDVLIHKFKVQIVDLRRLVHVKDVEIKNKEQIRLADSSKIKTLQNEGLICNKRLSIVEKEYCELQKTYTTQIEREEMLQEELTSVVSEIELLKIQKLKSIMKDKGTQIDKNDNVTKEPGGTQTCRNCVDKSATCEKFSEKPLLVKCSLSTGTQTLSYFINKSAQTIENYASHLQLENEKSRAEEENKRISGEYQHLLTVNNRIKQENEKLKQNKSHLEKEVSKASESEQAFQKYVNNIGNTNEKLKVELLENLQQFKEAQDAVECKSKQVEQLSRELDIALTNEEKENVGAKKKQKKIKSLEKELEETLSKCSQQSFEVKTLQGENEILSDKQKTFQERVGKLEKDLIKRRTQFDEMKVKWEESKNDLNEKLNIIEKLNAKVKTLNDRENSKKLFVDELKVKMDSLIKDKAVLQNTLSFLTAENNSKTELLQKTQHLCRQAETAINEIELSSTAQMENKHNVYKDKYNKLNLSYEKCFKHVNALKSVVKAFAEMIILKISENHKKMMEIKKHRKKKMMEEKQSKLMENKSSDVACSILGMSTQDLMEFMNDDNSEAKSVGRIDEKDMRNKLCLILKKEFNFEDVLERFLLDLVKCNENLLQQQIIAK